MDPHTAGLESRILSEICHILGEVFDLDRAFKKFLTLLGAFSSMTQGVIILKDPESGSVLIRASHGFMPGEAESAGELLGEKSLSQILVAREGFALPSLRQKPLALDKLKPNLWEKARIAFLGAPVLTDEVSLGVLLVDRIFADHIPVAEDLGVLSRLASLIAGLVNLHHTVKAREERWRWENMSLRAELAHGHQHLLVGESPATQALKHTITKVAESRAPVVLIGETGTGKTLMARLIHELSPRAGQPFVKVNCASLAEDLLEAELFGCAKGALAGSGKARVGRLEEADGGTLLLTEVDRLPQVLQVKILRFLEDQEFRRMGGTKIRQAEVRVIGAVQKDLRTTVKEGGFLEELHNQLAIFPIHVPPLRERREDIPALLNFFLDNVSREYGRRFYLTQQAQEVLTAYNWPGNVRELEHLVERLAVMADGSEIDLKDLPPYVGRGKKSEAAPATLSRLKELEKREIVAALERHLWVQSQAAMELGLTLRQMGYRVKQFGLDKLVKERRTRRTASKSKN